MELQKFKIIREASRRDAPTRVGCFLFFMLLCFSVLFLFHRQFIFIRLINIYGFFLVVFLEPETDVPLQDT